MLKKEAQPLAVVIVLSFIEFVLQYEFWALDIVQLLEFLIHMVLLDTNPVSVTVIIK